MYKERDLPDSPDERPAFDWDAYESNAESERDNDATDPYREEF